MHQGNAYDLLRFIEEEIVRLGLESSALAELLIYEKTKLNARRLDAPNLYGGKLTELNLETVVARRCQYIAERFHYDLKTILDGKSPERFASDKESWIIFAKTTPNFVDTIQTGRVVKHLLNIADHPRSVINLLGELESTEGIREEDSLRLIGQLYSRQLISEVNL